MTDAKKGAIKSKMTVDLSPVQREALAVVLGRQDRFQVTKEDVRVWAETVIDAALSQAVDEVRALEDIILDPAGRGRGQPRKRLSDVKATEEDVSRGT